jgi:hypothetical protein
MRIARPVGLSQDGRSLIVATPSGEELAVPVDDRLHATLRGDRPRLGQLEIEMENALGPRDIQSRIRAGQSLEEVGRVAGIPLDRVERFAAPVLAEREHIALVAMSSSVRRRGETSGHRLLRLAVTERLVKRGVDIDSVDWDAYRREDGRWSVTASYQSGESSRQALFLFDLQGRFSVADNDEARWVLGEQSSVKGPQPGRRRAATADGETEPDTEPTLDLSDELALVRVVQGVDDEVESAGPTQLRPAAEPAQENEQRDQADGPDAAASGQDDDGENETPSTAVDQLATVRGLYPVPDLVVPPEEAAGDDDQPGEDRRESALETLALMLDAQQDSGRAYGGLSDASAVPETDNSGWEPGMVVDYPVEPSPEDPPEEQGQDAHPATVEPGPERATAPDDPPAVQPEVTAAETADPKAPAAGPSAPGETAPGTAATEEAAPGDTATEEVATEEVAQPPAPRTGGKRKRAAVPSWDEIMFGGPPRSS